MIRSNKMTRNTLVKRRREILLFAVLIYPDADTDPAFQVNPDPAEKLQFFIPRLLLRTSKLSGSTIQIAFVLKIGTTMRRLGIRNRENNFESINPSSDLGMTTLDLC